MKKSAFFAQRVQIWKERGWRSDTHVIPSAETRAAADIEAAEAAGVVWDPEEAFPERLEVNPDSGMIVTREGGYRLISKSEAREVVRRSNAWPELRTLVDCLGDDGSPKHALSMEDKVRRMRLLAILDCGKEGE